MAKSTREMISNMLTKRRTRLLSVNHSAATLLVSWGFAMSCVPPGMVHAQISQREGIGEGFAASQETATGASATLPVSSSVPLSLHEAVKLALKQNPQLLAARLEALESKQTTKIIRSPRRRRTDTSCFRWHSMPVAFRRFCRLWGQEPLGSSSRANCWMASHSI
jgi:hypothetical protein